MVLVYLPKTRIPFAIDGPFIYSPRHSNIDKFTALNNDIYQSQYTLKAHTDISKMQQSADPAYIPQKNTIFCKIKYIICSWVQRKILLQKWIITKVAVYVGNIAGLFWFTDCVKKGGHGFFEEWRGVSPTTLFCSSLALQIQICLHEKCNKLEGYLHCI